MPKQLEIQRLSQLPDPIERGKLYMIRRRIGEQHLVDMYVTGWYAKRCDLDVEVADSMGNATISLSETTLRMVSDGTPSYVQAGVTPVQAEANPYAILLTRMIYGSTEGALWITLTSATTPVGDDNGAPLPGTGAVSLKLPRDKDADVILRDTSGDHVLAGEPLAVGKPMRIEYHASGPLATTIRIYQDDRIVKSSVVPTLHALGSRSQIRFSISGVEDTCVETLSEMSVVPLVGTPEILHCTGHDDIPGLILS
jgi:hypothetical protein